MDDSFDIREEEYSNSDKEIDRVLRPKEFEDFTGQPKIVENLKIFVEAAPRG